MSATITQNPAWVTPSDNPIIFVFDQDPLFLGNPKFNMSFLVEVSAYGSDANINGVIGTYEVFPELETKAKIDLSPIVAPYVPARRLKPINSTKTIDDTYGTLYVTINVTNKFSLDPNTPATGEATIPSGEIAVFKGRLTRKEMSTWDYTKYQKGAQTKRFLTDLPFTNIANFLNVYYQTVNKDDSFLFSWIDNAFINTPTNYKIKYSYFDINNNVIASAEEIFTTGNQGAIGTCYFYLPQHVSKGYLTSAQANNTTQVIIFLASLDDSVISAGMFVYFDDTCFRNGYTLKFMNKFGCYDNFFFTYNKRFSGSVKSFEYQNKEGGFDLLTGEYNLDTTNTGRITYLKEFTQKLELSSDWLPESIQNWLVQIYQSPIVYISEGENNENVVVTNQGYQLRQDRHDDLFNEIIEIEFTPENSIKL